MTSDLGASATSATSTDDTDAISLPTPSRGTATAGSATSCIASPTNPKTIERIKHGKIRNVHFDERVTVHTVPHWDPSRTQSFTDNYPQEPSQTCACCLIS